MAELSTLARPYANAAFEHAVAGGALESWSPALAMLAALAGDEKIAVLLHSPTYTGPERAAVLLRDRAGEVLGGLHVGAAERGQRIALGLVHDVDPRGQVHHDVDAVAAADAGGEHARVRAPGAVPGRAVADSRPPRRQGR